MSLSPHFLVVRITIALVFLAPFSAQAFIEETPVLVGDHGDQLLLAKISGALYSSNSTATQSRATQLAFGPGPDPAQVYLFDHDLHDGNSARWKASSI